jgi:glycosyltransferase involved in cell wall biosynthesis
VRHQWPPRTQPPPDGKWVLMQPWEFGSIPKAWLPMLRRVDEAWAYSRHVRDCYLEAGVPLNRVHVVPLGVDPEVFRPGLEPLALSGGPQLRFLFVGGTIFRKGIDVLLKSFGRAFQPTDGIGLVIKDMGSKTFYRDQTAEAHVRELRDRGYSVEYIEGDLTDGEMAALYSACDCLVHPFRGEGFALPVVEAMACGLPVIVTGAGPALDYATDETAYLIPARRGQFSECRVGEIETIGRPWLFEPAADALVELLKRVASDPAASRAKGAAASAHIREHFTWARTADAVEWQLMALAGDVGQAFQPDIRFDCRVGRDGAKLKGPAYKGVRLESLTYKGVRPESLTYKDVRLESLTYAKAERPRVSLTMIVRNEEANLPICLASVKGRFDEIVVVDTGSNDRTRDIAREFGARVFDFVWVDDFAAARNAALARARGDYAFWLDADDVIDPPERKKLEALLDVLGELPEGEAPYEPQGSASRNDEPPFEPHLSAVRQHVTPARASARAGMRARTAPRPPGAYVVKCSCDPEPDGTAGQTVVDHIRLFPVRGDVRWTYRVHEQILPALRRANVPVHWTDVVVRHTGYTDRALRARKLERDCKILRGELSDRPDDPFVLFNLGSIAIERQDWRQAIEHLRHSLAGSAATDSITHKLYALLARSHQMLGEFQQALAACARGLDFEPDDAELLFREAMVRRRIGDNDGAEKCWRRVLTLKRPDEFASVDQGIYGHLTRRNLAALARQRGNHDEARALWRAVLDECPNDREARSQLGE